MKAKGKQLVTETARAAGAQLSRIDPFSAVEEQAKRIRDEVKSREVSVNSGMIRISGGRVQGVIKTGDLVVEFDN